MNNLRTAVKFYRASCTNSNFVISDQFWSGLTEWRRPVVVKKLNNAGFFVFAGPGCDGAVIVSKRNKNLTITKSKSLVGGHLYDPENESVLLLHPYQATTQH